MFDEAKIFFFHGLESGPVGTKSRRLSEDFEVRSPDFREMGIWDRLEKAEELTSGMSDLVVVGSSFGGLLAALLYTRYPERFRGYVLMAPALHQDAAGEIDKMPERGIVIHGIDDEIVLLDDVRDIYEEFGVKVHEVDDNHRLHDSLELMVESVYEVKK